ncbi:MAG: DUF2341 domain-containing protein [bacterium]
MLKKIILIAILVLLIPQAAKAAFDNGYSYRKAITINASEVSDLDTANFTNFPVLISTAEAALATTGDGGNVTDAQGDDIIFTAADDAPLSFEVESYTSTSGLGTLIAWVKIPVLDYNDDTTIYMYYGNGDVSTSQENIYQVWSNGFVGVWHLNETSGNCINSASSSYEGTRNGTVVPVAGVVGNGQDFQNVWTDVATQCVWTDWFTVSSFPIPLPNGSVSIWVNPDSMGSGRVNPFGGHTNWELKLRYTPIRSIANVDVSSTVLTCATADYKASTETGWWYVTCDYLGSNKRIYIDGHYSNFAILTSGSPSSMDLLIGRTDTSTELFDGQLDEMRVSNTTRTAGWNMNEWNNMANPNAFATVGAEEEPAAPAAGKVMLINF